MKDNKAYWHDRQVEIFLLSERNALKLHADLKSSYQKAADSLNDELAKLYARYGIKEKIKQHELIKQLSPKELGAWRMKIEDYIALIHKLEQVNLQEAQALLLELNALSLRSRLTRLEAMQGQVTAQLAYLAAIEESEVHKHLKSEYMGTYYRLMYEGYKEQNPRVLALMQQHKVKVNPSAIAEVLSLPWSGSNYSARIWRRQYQVAGKVKELMTQHLLTGASVQRLTKMVTDELGKDYKYAAERLIRTETVFVHGQADLKMYEDLGIDRYEFIATLDNRTSEICRGLDLKVFKLSEAVVGKNYPPMHPNCRSTTGMYDSEWEGTRLAKGEDGKYYKVPGDMSYEQWYNYVENTEFEAPDVRSSEINRKVKELRGFLNSKNTEHANKVLGALENIKFIADSNIKAPFVFAHKINAIKYNPDRFLDFEDIMDYVVVHELAHKVDRDNYNTWKNPPFLKAIDIAKKAVSGKELDLRDKFYEGEEFEDLFILSDIFSALTQGKFEGPMGYKEKYWNLPKTVPAEIFANLSSIDLLEMEKEKKIIKDMFPELWNAYVEVIK